jgi:peptide/nickel transport system permease protein
LAAYLLRRVAAGTVVLLAVSFGTFVLVALAGDPLAQLRASPGVSQATLTAAAAQLHLNEPLAERYLGWLAGLLHGSLGTSYTGQPVGPQIAQRLLVTLKLVVPAVLVAAGAGVVTGVIGAVRQYRAADHLSTGLAYLFFATPVFVLGLLLKDFLAVDVNHAAGRTLLYTIGESTPGITGGWNVVLDGVRHSVLPVLTLVLVTYATWSRYQRAALLEVLDADYILLARAKGLPPRRVLLVHALRNALVPVVTLGALEFGQLLSGAVLTEQVFTIPGFGKLIVDAVFNRDYAVVQGVVLFTATAYIVLNLLADLAYFLVNPRLRA